MLSDVVTFGLVVMILLGISLVVWEQFRRRTCLPSKAFQKIDRSTVDPGIVNTVGNQIIPYIISGEILPHTMEYTAYRVYSYVRALLAGIVGLGIAHSDAIKWVVQGAPPDQPAPAGLSYAAIASAVVLLAFSVYANQTALEKRAVLAASCNAEMRGFLAKLLSIKAGVSAASQLDALANQIATVVYRHIAEKDWIFPDVIAPGIESRVEVMTDQILSRLTSTPSVEHPESSSGSQSVVTIQQTER